MVKRLGVAHTLQHCIEFSSVESGPKNNHYNFRSHARINSQELSLFTSTVEPFLTEDIMVRVEGAIFTIYCNDESLFEKICDALDQWITDVFVPDNETELNFMMHHKHKKVICNHIPFNNYQFRVNIKESMSAEARLKFFTWIGNYKDKIKAADKTAHWLAGSHRYVVSPYIYVKDSPMLSLVGLFLGDRLSTIQEFVPRHMINIETKEETCQV